jgi:hypothetical protein
MLLCIKCSDSKWETSQRPDGIHLTCSAMVRRESPGVFGACDIRPVVTFLPCGYTVVLPHYTAVVPTG